LTLNRQVLRVYSATNPYGIRSTGQHIHLIIGTALLLEEATAPSEHALEAAAALQLGVLQEVYALK